MAGNTGDRTDVQIYWKIPGDKTRYTDAPAMSKNPIQYVDETFENGDTVTSRLDNGKWIQESKSTDKNIAGQWETKQQHAATNARALDAEDRLQRAEDRRQRAEDAPKIPMPQTAEEKALTEASTAHQQALTASLAPKTVDVPVGPMTHSEGRTEQPTKNVTETQAKYDLDAQKQLLAQSQEAERLAQQKWANKIAEDGLDATKAHNGLMADLEKIRLSLQQQANELTARGQDISAGVTQRGQDMNRETSLASTTAHLHEAILPYWVPPGQQAQLEHVLHGGSRETMPSFTGAPAPYDPEAVVANAVTAARASAPAPLQLPAVSQPRPVGQPLQLPAATR